MLFRSDTTFHWFIAYIQVDRFTRKAVNHFDTERRKAASVVSLGSEEADGRLDESIETFLGGEVSLVTGHCRPEQCRAVDGVMPWHTAHCRQLTADIILDSPQFFGVIAPCHDIDMAADGGQTV